MHPIQMRTTPAARMHMTQSQPPPPPLKTTGPRSVVAVHSPDCPIENPKMSVAGQVGVTIAASVGFLGSGAIAVWACLAFAASPVCAVLLALLMLFCAIAFAVKFNIAVTKHNHDIDEAAKAKPVAS
jgi:hypothetical protein